jgi:hypothetical protein
MRFLVVNRAGTAENRKNNEGRRTRLRVRLVAEKPDERFISGFRGCGKRRGFRQRTTKSIPEGIKGWVKNHRYQPASILLASCQG